MRLWLMVLACALALTSCTVASEVVFGEFCGDSLGGVCSTADDCVETGCSGQVCMSRHDEPLDTICDWRECYDPDHYDLACGCVEGACAWH